MRNPIAIAGTACLLVLAGCEDGRPEAETKNITVPKEDYQAELEAMPEAQRNAVFIRAIRDAERECQRVESSASQGEINGAPAWTATCENGVQWTIAIGRDGIATVMNTAELQAAGGAAGNQTR